MFSKRSLRARQPNKQADNPLFKEPSDFSDMDDFLASSTDHQGDDIGTDSDTDSDIDVDDANLITGDSQLEEKLPTEERAFSKTEDTLSMASQGSLLLNLSPDSNSGNASENAHIPYK